jgi:hypothetical protein
VLFVNFALSSYFNVQVGCKSVNYRKTNTVKTASNLVSATAEFTACVKHGKGNLYCGFLVLFVNVNGNTASVITHRA